MRKLSLLALFITVAFTCVAQSKMSTLPPWLASALADPDTYVGVSPPSSNKDAAEDMAIATAVLNWTFNTGGAKARVVGEFTELHKSEEQISYATMWALEDTKIPGVLVSNIFFNENGECFVACKVRENKTGSPVFCERNTFVNLACDTLYDYAAFSMMVEVGMVAQRSRRLAYREIKGTFLRQSTHSSASISMRCNGYDFQNNEIMRYSNAGEIDTVNATFPVDTNFGSSLFRLITAFPPSLSSIRGRQVGDEMRKDSNGSTEFSAWTVYESLGITSPFYIKFCGIADNSIVFDLDQNNISNKFRENYSQTNPKVRTGIATSASSDARRHGMDVALSVALQDALYMWMENYQRNNFKNRTIDLDDQDEDFARFYSAYERLAEADDLSLLWHIGDGNTQLPSDLTGYDFDYSCGVSVLDMKSVDDKIKLLEENIAGLEQYLQQVKEKGEILKDQKNKEAELAYCKSLLAAYNDRPADSEVASSTRNTDGLASKTQPASASRAENTYAVIIANENYDEVPSIPTAGNDGEEFNRYLTNVLGVRSENIFFYKDATYGKMMQALEKIKKASKIFNDIDVIFYYAGHGIPDVASKAPYLLPVDADPSSTAVCLSVDSVFSTLGRLPLHSATVFLDACFSGTQRDADNMLVSARGVRLKPKNPEPRHNLVVFSACSGDQTAYSLSDKNHGAFTYHLLEKLRQTGGQISLGELSDYLNEVVPRTVFTTLDKVQTPTVTSSPDITDSWRSRSLFSIR